MESVLCVCCLVVVALCMHYSTSAVLVSLIKLNIAKSNALQEEKQVLEAQKEILEQDNRDLRSAQLVSIFT